jgi:hypothetical protein
MGVDSIPLTGVVALVLVAALNISVSIIFLLMARSQKREAL